ncbi:hypothetical protein STEG23_033280, partial [Scotinomys teguina]
VSQKNLVTAPLAKKPPSLAVTNDQRHLDNPELHTGPYGVHPIIKVYKKGQEQKLVRAADSRRRCGARHSLGTGKQRSPHHRVQVHPEHLSPCPAPPPGYDGPTRRRQRGWSGSRDNDSSPKWGKHLTSIKYPKDFASTGVIRLTRHKFRCQKPYSDKTFKVPDLRTADSLRSLRARMKSTSSNNSLEPINEQKENKEEKVPLLKEVPECRSDPLSCVSRPSICLASCQRAHTWEGKKKPDYVYCV